MTSTQPNKFEADQYSELQNQTTLLKKPKMDKDRLLCYFFFFTLKAKKYSKKFAQKTLKNDCYCLVFSILKV